MHWDDFYKNSTIISSPSSFAEFAIKFIELVGKKNICDIGCGNGRDTHYFYGKKLNVIGIDYCSIVIKKNKKKYPHLDFCAADVAQLEKVSLKLTPDCVYSRFFLHAITHDSWMKYLDWVTLNLADDGLFLIETRSDKDPMFGVGEKISEYEYINGHYRRFINLDQLVDQLYIAGLSIIYVEEVNNLSVLNEDNPVLIRVVAQKTNQQIPKPNTALMHSRNNVVDFIRNMNEKNINIFATCGTLLGAVRCNGITPWDTDIDIGILYDDFVKMLDVLEPNRYILGSNQKNNDGSFKNYKIKSSNFLKNVNLNKEMVGIYDTIDNFYVQLNVMKLSNDHKPAFWSDFNNEPFIIHMNQELREGYEKGRYNIPLSLFYPMKKCSFYDTNIQIHEESEYLLKHWYGENCLTHYPKSSLNYLDTDRFLTSKTAIIYNYAI